MKYDDDYCFEGDYSQDDLNALEKFYNNVLLLGETRVEFDGWYLSKSAKDRWVLEGIHWRRMPRCKTLKIPEFIEEIGSSAIPECSLFEIRLPKGLKVINDYAFRNCHELDRITFPSTLEKIGKYAFEYTELYSIYIPDKVKRIGTGAFKGCTRVTKISIPSGIHLENLCFEGAGLQYNSLASTLDIRPFPKTKDSALERLIGPYATLDNNVTEKLNPFYSSNYRRLIKVIHNMYIVRKPNV